MGYETTGVYPILNILELVTYMDVASSALVILTCFVLLTKSFINVQKPKAITTEQNELAAKEGSPV